MTEEHMKLLAEMLVGWNGDEYGAPSINPKRPYGNGDVERDIAKAFGWYVSPDDDQLTRGQRDHAKLRHEQMETVLQILVRNAGTGIRPGVYERSSEYDVDWKPA